MCPIDGGELELIEWDSTPAPLSGPEMARVYRMGLHAERFTRDIHTGLLLNRRRQLFFPIVDGVPRMLVFPTAIVTQFARRNRVRIERDAPGFSPPSGARTYRSACG